MGSEQMQHFELIQFRLVRIRVGTSHASGSSPEQVGRNVDLVSGLLGRFHKQFAKNPRWIGITHDHSEQSSAQKNLE